MKYIVVEEVVEDGSKNTVVTFSGTGMEVFQAAALVIASVSREMEIPIDEISVALVDMAIALEGKMKNGKSAEE